MKSILEKSDILQALIFCGGGIIFPQTTGKISEKVIDAKTGEALPGANVQIVGTSTGAATSLEGDYFLLNVPPGIYNIRVQYMGYNSMEISGLQVSDNRTANAASKLTGSVVEAESVPVATGKVAHIKKKSTLNRRWISYSHIIMSF